MKITSAERRFNKDGFIYGIHHSLFSDKEYLIYFDDFDKAKEWCLSNVGNELVTKVTAEEWQKQCYGG